jgi:multidrug resistance efflux pump
MLKITNSFSVWKISAAMIAVGLVVVLSVNDESFSESLEDAKIVDVKIGEFAVHAVYNGKLESRNVVTILSKFRGTATIVELVPEGSQVSAGDLLVRFDSTKLDHDLVKFEKEYALAQSELLSLEQAKLPLELRELELLLLEARSDMKAEKQYLRDSITLQKDELISEQELKKQQLKVSNIESKLGKLEMEFNLTRKFLHPASLEVARTKLHSAKQALALAREQLKHSLVVAPTSGVVVYKQLNIGGEFRTVRVGDDLFPNQPFMVLPDMQKMVVHIDIPESELSRIKLNGEAFVRPLAYRDLSLPGTVETIGAVAQTLPGRPSWQKYFHVVIRIDEIDPGIRPGMSVTAHVLSFYKPKATLISRRGVSWDAGKAVSKVVHGNSFVTRELSLGLANDMYYEVIEGVKSGDRVVIQ